MKYILLIFLIMPGFLYANQQNVQVEEYLNEVNKKVEFISTYREASKSFRKKREYTLQEELDYMCNISLLYSDLITFQSKYLQLEKYSEVQTVNRQTEDVYQDLQRFFKKNNVSCSDDIVNVPVDTF
ncbi:hypothetical protein [Acinetobacter radioresistens]|uniref:hypothetical protein n=1 Tax=Acinetobacter radioresistens TaxID=40216 RepID=UPI00125029DD|nr:hypothetical protein [Acinetobacter radioresistens]